MPNNRQRREAERRRLQRQVQRRAQREARRRRVLLVASIVGTLVVIAIVLIAVTMSTSDNKKAAAGSKSPSPTTTATTPTASPSSSVAPYPCTWTKSGTAAKPVSVPPTTTPPKTGTVDVLVTTNRGPMTFALNRAEAPCAVESFVSLTEQNYFDSTPCHRLTTTGIFVLQCGDPTGTGSGGPGYSFADELSGKEKYTPGVLAMANAGPNTNGSQFFIVYKNSPLPASYTVFGKLTSGLPVVDEVAAKGATGTTGDGKPKLAVTLKTVNVVQ